MLKKLPLFSKDEHKTKIIFQNIFLFKMKKICRFFCDFIYFYDHKNLVFHGKLWKIQIILCLNKNVIKTIMIVIFSFNLRKIWYFPGVHFCKIECLPFISGTPCSIMLSQKVSKKSLKTARFDQKIALFFQNTRYFIEIIQSKCSILGSSANLCSLPKEI